MNKDFLQNFIENFFEGIENDLENLLKKEKNKKLSVGKFNIDVIDYVNGSETPFIDTIKLDENTVKIYVKNSSGSSLPYTVEEIFHPFSLSTLADTLTEKNKYSKLLENFYLELEENFKNFLGDKKEIFLENLDFETLAIYNENGKFNLIEGVATKIFLENDRIFFILNEENKEYPVHLIQCNVSDLIRIFNLI